MLGDNFVPVRSAVTNVTSEVTPTVTTATDHGFVVGQYINLHVPGAYGMSVPGVQGVVKSVPSSTTFTTDINTSNQSAFTAPPSLPAFTQAHVCPVSGNFNNYTSITGATGSQGPVY